jgi:hypothetical protein
MLVVVGMVIGLLAVVILMRRWTPDKNADLSQRRGAMLRAGLAVAAVGVGLVLLSVFVVK